MNSKTGLAAVVMSVSMSLMASLPDPIAWWKMDALENGKIADLSGNGRDLTVASDCSISGREFVRGVQTEMQALYLPATSNSWATFSCPALTSRTLSMWVWRGMVSTRQWKLGLTCFSIIGDLYVEYNNNFSLCR